MEPKALEATNFIHQRTGDRNSSDKNRVNSTGNQDIVVVVHVAHTQRINLGQHSLWLQKYTWIFVDPLNDKMRETKHSWKAIVLSR